MAGRLIKREIGHAEEVAVRSLNVFLTRRCAASLAAAALLLSTAAVGSAVVFAPAEAAETPKRGGKITVSLNRAIRGFDHIAIPQGGMARRQAIFAVHERLFDMDPKTGKLIPQLGVSATPSDDFKTWRVELRKGAKFSNGKEVTAEAYEWHFDRLFSSPLAGKYKGEMGVPIEKVAASGRYTLEFRFSAPAPGFRTILAEELYFWTLNEPGFAKANYKKKDYNLMSVGAGPYMVKEYVPRKHMVLVRNPHYYAPERQFLDQLTLRIHSGSESVRYRSLKAGDIAAFATRGFSFSTASKDRSVDLLIGSRTSTSASINFNVSRPPFNDIRVRRALLYAMDRDAIAKVLGRGWAGARAGNSMINRASRWYCPDVRYPKQDVAKAKQLLKDYGKPVKSVIWSGGISSFLKYSEIVQEMAANVGIELEVKNAGRGIAALVGAINKGIPDLWVTAYGSVSDPLQIQTQFHSKHKANFWKIKSAKIDASIDKLRAAQGFKDRYAANCGLQRAFHDELPFIYGIEAGNGIIKQKWLKGLPPPHNTIYMWHRAWVDK